MSDGIKKMLAQDEGFLLDVNQHDITNTNQISNKLAALIGRIEDQWPELKQTAPNVWVDEHGETVVPYARFRSFNHTSKQTQLKSASNAPNAPRYEVPHIVNVTILNQYRVFDPWLKIPVNVALLREPLFKTDNGKTEPIVHYDYEGIRFNKINNGQITLYANNPLHQKLYQFLMLHPDNKDNVLRAYQIAHNDAHAINMTDTAFRFHRVENEMQAEVRRVNDALIKTRVFDALKQLHDSGADRVLRMLYASQAINPSATGVIDERTRIGNIYSDLTVIAQNRPDRIDQMLGSEEILRWRKVYMMMGHEFKLQDGILKHGTVTIAADVDQKQALLEAYSYVMSNPDLQSELLLNPTAETPLLNQQGLFDTEGKTRNKGGRPRSPITS